jgi:hypothetical protein
MYIYTQTLINGAFTNIYMSEVKKHVSEARILPAMKWKKPANSRVKGLLVFLVKVLANLVLKWCACSNELKIITIIEISDYFAYKA